MPTPRKSGKRTSRARKATGARTSGASGTPPGPLTIQQARAVAAVKVKRSPLKPAVATATNLQVGAAQKKLAIRYRKEIRERIRHYRATYALLAKHGTVKPAPVQAAAPKARARAAPTPAPKRAVAAFATAAAGPPPLRILAEGDSWFDYPAHIRGGVIPRLETQLGVPILNLAKAGDEARYMLGVDEREVLDQVLLDAAHAGTPYDAILFSGGGNDIVGNPMCLWVTEWDSTQPPESRLDTARFEEVLDVVKAAYEDLIATRDQLAPTARLFFHGYDFAIADGRGICGLGPWLRPTFKYRHFPSKVEGTAVVKVMLMAFNAMLAQLAANNPNVTLIPTQGTLDSSQWSNELHPSDDGFDDITNLFESALRATFPGRIP